jgi:hypothetical protein
MSNDSILSLFLGIPLGIISGLYTGIIVTRYARFAELRNETLRIIRSIDFMQESAFIHISNDEELSKFMLISGDMYFLKHSKAAEQVNQLRDDIEASNREARFGRISMSDYSKRYGNWQDIARNLSPNKFVICSLWASL